MHRVVHSILKHPHNAAYSPMTVNMFQQLVAIPYLSMKLIAGDHNITDQEAWLILKASTLYGLVQFPHDDDVSIMLEKVLQPKVKRMRVRVVYFSFYSLLML